ncbi:pyrimidine utilization protein D [Marinibactrum halimedae]|uniref:Putative carbamate hydrolase RutD n=1 Tax=Marinibactrum halimedae TaxID=1444977 RepID=A0AA37TEK7_9GAMM|nr:pyrimidine utilization protein D [Marinibactrum halimedae]MCD9457971.1 pyrimidine utilization protein D [Marinibactrum halimedae]GLS27597.1 putative aminoacrylate hydrolase RutD [Marinibactrum halimedae]
MHYELHGLTESSAPTLVFISGLGGSANYWKPQLPAFIDQYRVLVYDQLGTGRSPATLSDQYSIQDMANELKELLESLTIQCCHIIGHALGGLVALHIAQTNPELLDSIVLVNAWSQINPHTERCFSIRKAILDNCSKEDYLHMQALLLYPPDWIASNVELLKEEEQHWLSNFPDKSNLLARINALSEFDIESELHSIHVNSLIIANKDDTLVPWQRSEILAEHLPQSTFTLMDYGGHACTVTEPKKFNQILITHLNHNL